jgi:hypothetical protein
MIKDARARIDCISQLHLDSAFKSIRGRTASEPLQQTTLSPDTSILHSQTHQATRLRERLNLIRRLARLAQGHNIKIEVARRASNSLDVTVVRT